MKHRRELTCTACGETIESEVFHCMSGDILCTDCMASQYAAEHQLDRKAALAQVKDDPLHHRLSRRGRLSRRRHHLKEAFAYEVHLREEAAHGRRSYAQE